jgi:hypothetical protein
VTAEHSSLNEIVSKARYIENTLNSLKSGHKSDKQSELRVPSIADAPKTSAHTGGQLHMTKQMA